MSLLTYLLTKRYIISIAISRYLSSIISIPYRNPKIGILFYIDVPIIAMGIVQYIPGESKNSPLVFFADFSETG